MDRGSKGPDSDHEPCKRIKADYANYFEIGSNQYEIVIEFGQYYSVDNRPILHTRIITNPSDAKRFLRQLAEIVGAHEAEHGELPEPLA